MKAVQLVNGRTHWVYDDQQTLCGRYLIDLNVQREIDVPDLPGDRCRMCNDLATTGGLLPAARITLKPSFGFLRKQGSTSHGPRSKERGQKLWGDQ